jgi:putative oxidoreductase
MRKDLGLLLVRVGVGATVAAHGAQKLFGWFGGGGLDGTSKMFEMGGFNPAKQHAMAAGLTEAGAGTLLALGLATPAAGAALAGNMAVAGELHKPAGFFATKGGFEYPLMLGITGAGLSLSGPGKFSVDRLLGFRLARPWMAPFGLAVAALSAIVMIRRRHAQLEAQQIVKAQSSVTGEAEADVTAAESHTRSESSAL